MNSATKQRQFTAAVIAGGALLLLVLAVPQYLYHLLVHPDLHVLIGVSGAIIAILSGSLIIGPLAKSQSRLTCAGLSLIGCGILDLFHTFATFEVAAPLHSSSLILGAIGLALVWSRRTNEWTSRYIRILTTLLVITVCALSFGKLLTVSLASTNPETTQTALSILARLLNSVACVLYFAAFAYFIRQHFRSDKRNQLMMAIACVLMCAAGLGDSTGSNWTSDWWGSHVFRCVGYLLILLYVLESQRAWSDTVDTEHKRLLAILNGFDDFIYISDPETHELLFVNDKVKSAFGENLVGRKCHEVLQGESRPCSFCTNKHIFGDNAGQTHVWEFKNQQNQRWYRCSDKAIVWTNGKMARFEMATDITEQKQTQLTLKDNEERLRQIAETLDAVFWLYDTATREMLYVSPAFETIFGYEAEEIHDGPFHWISHIIEEDRAKVSEAFEKQATHGYNVEYRIVGADAQQRTIHDRGFPIKDSEGNIIRLAGIAQDVTEIRFTETALKQSRDNFQLALDSANAGVFFYEFKPDRLRWDARSLEIYGISAEDFRGDLTGWEDRLHRDDGELALTTFLAALKEKQTQLSLRYRIVRPDQTIRHILATMIIEYDAQNEPLQLTGLHFDETPKVQMDTELIQARRTAESANRAKSTFLANMSHEIRSPMNAVMGFLQLMQMEDMQPHQKKWLDLMWRGSEHLLELINEVLDISKIEAGMTSIRKSDFELVAMLEETVSIFRMKATKQGLKLHFYPGPGLDEPITGDKGKLRQILINLLSNALKFTKVGSVTVRTGIDSSQPPSGEDKRRLFIEVRDTGIGLSADDAKNVFEPFAQTQAGETHNTGTGLGLTLCREYAQLMGGEIEVVTRLGQGSCFKVIFEVEVAQSAEQVKPNAHLAISQIEQTGKRIKTLIVDDDPFAIRMMSEMLRRVGCETTAVESGEKALIHFNEDDYELIFLDIRMPGIGGEKTLQSLKKQISDEQVRIVVVSAGIFEEDRQRLLEEGADEVLYKPIRFKQLSDEIAKVRG